MPNIDPSDWAQYQSVGFTYSPRPGITHYIEPDPSGATVGEFPFATSVSFVTAYNPGGPVVAAATNLAQHTQLLTAVELAGWEFVEAIGGNPNAAAREQGVLILNAPDQAVNDMGYHFGQDAIYHWSTAEFVLEACGPVESRQESFRQGWRIKKLPPE